MIDGPGSVCDAPKVCVNNPYRGPECGLACDFPGLCVEPVRCGGKRKLKCSGGRKCVDDPRDGCDPLSGGVACLGLCV